MLKAYPLKPQNIDTSINQNSKHSIFEIKSVKKFVDPKNDIIMNTRKKN